MNISTMNDQLYNETLYNEMLYNITLNPETENLSVSHIPYTRRDADIWKELDYSDFIKIMAYTIIIIGGLLGNVSVILTVVFNRSMRTTINYYVANLAVADAMICIVCMMPHALSGLLIPDVYILGTFMCKFNPFTQMTSLTSSVLTLSAISCDRFMAIMFPLRVRIIKQRTSVVLTIVWIISILVSVPFLIAKRHTVVKLEPKCSEKWPTQKYYEETTGQLVYYQPLRVLYYITVTITLFFLPIVIMIAAYSLILCRLWMTDVPGERHAANLNIQSRARKKVNKMVFCVLVAFIICWTPIQAMILYSAFHDARLHGPVPGWFSDFKWFSYYIAYGNSFLNPIIYGGFNKTFREGFYIILRCGYPRNQFRKKGAVGKSGVTSFKRPNVFTKSLQSMNTTITSLKSRTETFFSRSKTKKRVPTYQAQVMRSVII